MEISIYCFSKSDIEILPKKSTDVIKNIYLDPTGKHLIIVTEGEDTYYLYEKWKKPKLMTKFRVNYYYYYFLKFHIFNNIQK